MSERDDGSTSSQQDIDERGFERLVVVTQREPFRVVDRNGAATVERSPGGLVAALDGVMRETQGVWVSADPRGTANDPALMAAMAELPFQWVPATYPPELDEGFYRGTSNGALWPLYHSMLGRTVFDRSHWAHYVEVNRRIARKVAEMVQPNDFIWVHDYQLSLVPGLLREIGVPDETRIGFFLHIPFPSFDIFRTLPWARQILRGMLGSSLVGFHVAEYAHHFYDCVEEILDVRCDRLRDRVHWQNRWVHLCAVPISIDPRRFRSTALQPEVRERAHRMREEVGAEHLVIGVDRLDYSKGILERMVALETFFERYPDRKGQVSMIQLAVPSRGGIQEYDLLREEIERQVGHINGLYARPGWTPLTYMWRSLPFPELVALLLAGDVAMVTPLRDGMNLVSKEYVAARAGEPGVLILSKLAGAAQQLTDALLVNPYDVDQIADSLEHALRLSEEAKRSMMRRLYVKVRRFDLAHWVDTFLKESFYVE